MSKVKAKERLTDKNKNNRLLLYLGFIVFFILLLLPSPQGLPVKGKNVLVLLLFQMYLLVTQVLPFGVVGLIPVIFLPLLGILGPQVDSELLLSSVQGYSSDVIFLVIAGFFIGGAMQKWGLHKRVSYTIASVVGNKPSTIILGFMIATSVISMFLTNTATVVMMMPIAVAFIKATNLEKGNLFAAALVTSISYSANIGGVGTPTGSSLSAGAIGLIPELTGEEFTYSMYLGIGIPFVVVSILCAWLILKLVYKPDEASGIENVQKDTILEARNSLGEITKNEVYVIVIILLLVVGLLTRPFIWGKHLPFVSDGIYATLVSFLLFLIPVSKNEFLYTWDDAKQDVDLGLLLMVGGFLTIGKLLGPTGVTEYLASIISNIEGVSGLGGVYALSAITNLLSNFGVNMFAALPISYAVAKGLGLSIPLTLFVVTCVAQLLKCGILISISNIIIAPLVIRFISMRILGIGLTW